MSCVNKAPSQCCWCVHEAIPQRRFGRPPVAKDILPRTRGIAVQMAEMERDLLVERTQAGLARAKRAGKPLGRPSKTTLEQRAEITAKYEQGESVSALARSYRVSRASILGVVRPALTTRPSMFISNLLSGPI